MLLKLVVDANVLLKLYAPELALEELQKYKGLICKKSAISESDFEESIKLLKISVNFKNELFFNKFLSKAKDVSPDIDDAAYFALALKLNSGIWSNENKLKK